MGVSVGNAAWPIGVTQVGLHERSAREKIRLGAGTTVVSGLLGSEGVALAIKAGVGQCERVSRPGTWVVGGPLHR